MIRNHAGAVRAFGKVPMRCTACRRHTERVYNEDRGGFGVCKCGGELRRAGVRAEELRIEKAKRDLAAGGATR